MKRGATSIEKAFAGVAVLAVAGLAAVTTALAGPSDGPSTDAGAPIVTESAIGDETAAVSIASGGAIARSVLTGRSYDASGLSDCKNAERVCGGVSIWSPRS